MNYFFNMKNICMVLLSSMFLSCAPQKKLNRLLKNHPELITRDTIIKNDTTITSGFVFDTVIVNTITRDTLYFHENKLEIRYYNTGDSISFQATLIPDTIIKPIPVIVNQIGDPQIIYEAHWYDVLLRWVVVALVIAFFISGFFIFKVLSNIKK